MRDHLVDMLESYWPEIEPFFVSQTKPEPLRTVLQAIAERSSGQHALCANPSPTQLCDLAEFHRQRPIQR